MIGRASFSSFLVSALKSSLFGLALLARSSVIIIPLGFWKPVGMPPKSGKKEEEKKKTGGKGVIYSEYTSLRRQDKFKKPNQETYKIAQNKQQKQKHVDCTTLQSKLGQHIRTLGLGLLRLWLTLLYSRHLFNPILALDILQLVTQALRIGLVI
jgi:hypothetical protein